jgi:hypothetical protein
MAGAVQHYRTIKARRPSEKANRLIIATRWSSWRIVRSAARSPTSLAGAAHHRGCGVARAPERIAMYRRAGFSCPGAAEVALFAKQGCATVSFMDSAVTMCL